MKSLYYQFVNFIQEMQPVWFVTIWCVLFCGTLIFVMKFFKIYNGEQKSFEKVSYIFIAIILFALLVYLTYLRK